MARAPLKFSVIVASRDRAAWLKRCISSLRQQQHSTFEVIVVADDNSLHTIDHSDLKIISFNEPNLAKARNLGIAEASGEVCAFIDDDAVAEPLWLHHLAQGLEALSTEAAVGFVRGRNGISYQSQAHSVDAEAETHTESSSGRVPFVPVLTAGRAVKLVGTNMALRRKTLYELGGFDENYRFFLEDADLSLRLAHAGAKSAIVPMAQVHHGFAPSLRRSQLRVPLDLFDIGRSTSYYLKRHFVGAKEELWQRTKERERARLVKHMVLGTCEPRDVKRRLQTLRLGWDEGLSLSKVEKVKAAPSGTRFLKLPEVSRQHEVFASPWIHKRALLRRRAAETVDQGNVASVFAFSLTSIKHHVRYTDDGFWLQTGGIFGQSVRAGALFKWCRFAERLEQEIRRVANERGISESAAGIWWDHSRL